MFDHLPSALERRFTLGQNPRKRKAFFERLRSLCESYGEPCFRQVKIVAMEAQGKNRPGNYFCAAVLRRLQDHGYVETDDSLDAPAAAVQR